MRVHLRPSRALATAIVVAHAAALGAAVLALPAVGAAVAAAGVALSAVAQLRLTLQWTPLAVAGFEFGTDGKVAIAGPAGDWCAATLRTVAVPAAWVAVATLRDLAGRRRALVVLPDAIDAEAFRRLRVWLRWGVPPVVGGTGVANIPTGQ